MLASLLEHMDHQQIIPALFGAPRALIGMIHLQALPGTPGSRHAVREICDQAVDTARVLEEARFHGLMIENMHDRPYLKRAVGPEVVAAMAVVGRAVRQAVALPLGVQVLAGANREALAVAQACGASFIRTESFVYAHVADEGLMDSDAGELLRYRRAIGAESIRVFVDVEKKHASHAVSADVGLVEMARAAEFFLADGVIVTGAVTGHAADPTEVEAVSLAVDIPTLVGSGVTPENLGSYATADALIVGSALKRQGLWSNPLDPDRIAQLAQAFAALPAALRPA